MLWKLADNVKYEEDCEVRTMGRGGTKEGGPAWVSTELRRPPTLHPLLSRLSRRAGFDASRGITVCVFMFSFGEANSTFLIFEL